MTPGSSYSRAPIVEAIFDIQVELPEKFKIDTLLKCQRKVKKEYPEQKNARYVTGQITADGHKVSSSASSESAGFVFVSEDKKRMFRATLTGFTFNWLAPYPGWQNFFAEAKRLWEEYRDVVHPRVRKRAALRYINRFDFSSPIINMETYFRTYPEISRDLPQLMAGFFVQFNLPIDDIKSMATITQTMVVPKEPGNSSVLLDIDLYRTESLPPGDELWRFFETLRKWKNKIFEDCITDSTREKIQ